MFSILNYFSWCLPSRQRQNNRDTTSFVVLWLKVCVFSWKWLLSIPPGRCKTVSYCEPRKAKLELCDIPPWYVYIQVTYILCAQMCEPVKYGVFSTFYVLVIPVMKSSSCLRNHWMRKLNGGCRTRSRSETQKELSRRPPRSAVGENHSDGAKQFMITQLRLPRSQAICNIVLPPRRGGGVTSLDVCGCLKRQELIRRWDSERTC